MQRATEWGACCSRQDAQTGFPYVLDWRQNTVESERTHYGAVMHNQRETRILILRRNELCYLVATAARRLEPWLARPTSCRTTGG